MSNWTAENMGDQTGRVAIVTGANTGIGFEAARELARHGADVIIASRSSEKGRAAVGRLQGEKLAGNVSFMPLDLADLASVRAFADAFLAEHRRLDLLINNAGVMMPTERQTTRDGFELQIGTNHFGHFALTGLLLETILATPGSRIVNVASIAHRGGRIDFDDLHSERKAFNRMQTYSDSKLANLLFTNELQRRLTALGSETLVVAAHPGWTMTDLQRHSPFIRLVSQLFGQSAPRGALPTLRAATGAGVAGGDYFGPRGWNEFRGAPVKVDMVAAAHDQAVAGRLWQVSEEATGVSFAARLSEAA